MYMLHQNNTLGKEMSTQVLNYACFTSVVYFMMRAVHFAIFNASELWSIQKIHTTDVIDSFSFLPILQICAAIPQKITTLPTTLQSQEGKFSLFSATLVSTKVRDELSREGLTLIV